MTTEINNPELLNQPSNNPEIEGSPETDTSLNELITTISLDDVTNQTRKILNPKDWVENIINKELNGISFYKLEGNELKFDINNITQYLSEFKDFSSYREYREKVSKDQEYAILIAVQILLVSLGEKNLVIDGLYGRETKKAVIAFQKRYNEHSDDKIKVDGIIGPKTISALLNETNTKNGNPTVDPDVQADPTQDEQPAADPTQDEQPAAGPAQDEQPAVGPAQDEQPAAGPTQDEQPAVDPAQDEQSAVGPAQDEQPAVGPTQDEQPAVGPTQDEQPAAGPAQDEQPAVVIPNPVIDEDEPSNDDTKPENQESLEVLDENSYGKFNCEYKSGEKFENKEVKDGTELVIKSVKELMFFTKDKNVLRLYNEQYFQTKDLAIKYFDIANTADPGYDIVKAEKKGNEITVSYVDLPASNVYGCDVMTGQCLFVECEKDDKVEWTEEGKNNNNTNNGNIDVVDNGNNDVVDNTDSDMKKIRDGIDKSIRITDGEITVIDGQIIIGDKVYVEIREGETGLGYRIINGILIIGIWDSTGTTRGETIIIDKSNNIYKGDIVDGKMVGMWIIITITEKIIRVRYNNKTPIRIVTPDKPDDSDKPEDKEKQDESVEVIKEDKYGEFYFYPAKGGEKFGENIEIQNGTELVLKSVDELRFFTDDDDLLAKYNEEYFQSKSLAIKYFDINALDRYEIVKAEKKGGKIVVTYDYKQPEVKHGMGLLSGECLYVECENNEEVEWAEKSENDTEKSEKVKEIVDIKNDLEKYINNGEITIVDGRIKIGDVEYVEIVDGQKGLGYRIIDGVLIIGIWESDETTNGVTIIREKDGSIYRGEIIDGKRTGLWIRIDINYQIERINYDENKIDNSEIIDGIDKKIADLKEKLNNLGSWTADGSFEFADGVVDADTQSITFNEKEYKKYEDGITGLAYKVEDGKLIIGNFNEGKLDGVAIEYNTDKNFYYGKFEAGERNGIGIEYVDGSKYVYLYENGKILVKEDINSADKEIAEWADIMNTDIDELSKLIEAGQEKEYDLDAIKTELYEINGKVAEIITLGGENGRAFKDGVETAVEGEGSQITFDGQTYTKIDSLEGVEDGYHYYIDNGRIYMYKFENGHIEGSAITVDNTGGIHKYNYENGKLMGTITLLRLNGDILVDEYENGIQLSREKLLSGDIEKMKSIREQLSSIITINENGEFDFPTQGEDVILNSITYKNIPADSLSQYTGDGYILSHDEGNNQDYYQFGHFVDGKLDGEAILLYNSGNIYLGNFSGGEELNGMKCDTEGNVYDYTVDTEGGITETPKRLENIEDIPYSERMKKFAEEKEKLTELKNTLDPFIHFDKDGKIVRVDNDIKFGNPEQTYVDGNSEDFQGGFCYKIFDNENGTQYIIFGNYDKNNKVWLDGETYSMDNAVIWTYNIVNGYNKNYSDLSYNSGSQCLIDYNDEGGLLLRQDLSNNGTITIKTYNESGLEDNVMKIEKPDEYSLEDHINTMADLLNDTVEYDAEKSEFKFKDAAEIDSETKELKFGGRNYAKWTPDMTGRAYTFDDFAGQKAFVLGDFVDGKLTGNAAVIMADGRVVSGEFKDSMLDGVAIQKVPEGAVYLYKYSQGREICHEKVSDTNMDIVNQDYMNEIIGEFLSEEEPVTGGGDIQPEGGDTQPEGGDTQPEGGDTQPGGPDTTTIVGPDTTTIVGGDTTRIASDTTTIRG